tara:strand:- start:2554 stop:3009 length:456 start_codon:yes stop_codon:yes gene_type:complete
MELTNLGRKDGLYNENLGRKARVSEKRRKKFTPSVNGHKRKHWPNRASSFVNEEERKGPKHWNKRNSATFIPGSARPKNPIKSAADLRVALYDISKGLKDHHNYTTNSSLIRDRLKATQSLRDRGVPIDLRYITKADQTQLQKLKNRALYS